MDWAKVEQWDLLLAAEMVRLKESHLTELMQRHLVPQKATLMACAKELCWVEKRAAL
jgi:hypothetical protein